MPVAFDFNPLAPRGARLMSMRTPMASPTHFNPLAPRGARPGQQTRRAAVHHFNPLAPRGARRDKTEQENKGNRFQSTRPSRGETGLYRIVGMPSSISIHSPLAGRDGDGPKGLQERYDFNPLAPRGARQQTVTKYFLQKLFTLHNSYPCKFGNRDYKQENEVCLGKKQAYIWCEPTRNWV